MAQITNVFAMQGYFQGTLNPPISYKNSGSPKMTLLIFILEMRTSSSENLDYLLSFIAYIFDSYQMNKQDT